LNKLFNQVERYLVRYILICLVAVVVIQGLMTHDSYRLFLSWSERMEGQEISYPATVDTGDTPSPTIESPQARMVITIESFSSLPLARLLVNGQEEQSFDQKEIVVKVKGGDKLEIDSSSYNFPVKYRIKAVSANVGFPEADSCYTANQGVVMIGNVIVK